MMSHTNKFRAIKKNIIAMSHIIYACMGAKNSVGTQENLNAGNYLEIGAMWYNRKKLDCACK